jgi:hypothetical protein
MWRFHEGQRLTAEDLNALLDLLWALADRVAELERRFARLTAPLPKPPYGEMDNRGVLLD